jgi:inosine/xanthosine triphosphate pyrophosphatase family protein
MIGLHAPLAPIFELPPVLHTRTVFVTGNAGKLKEVREILASGPQPIEVESHDLDCQSVQLIPLSKTRFSRSLN